MTKSVYGAGALVAVALWLSGEGTTNVMLGALGIMLVVAVGAIELLERRLRDIEVQLAHHAKLIDRERL